MPIDPAEFHHIAQCAVQDCKRIALKWMVTEVAPGRPIVYPVCAKDLAAIMEYEREGGHSG